MCEGDAKDGGDPGNWCHQSHLKQSSKILWRSEGSHSMLILVKCASRPQHLAILLYFSIRLLSRIQSIRPPNQSKWKCKNESVNMSKWQCEITGQCDTAVAAFHGSPLGLQCKNCQYRFIWQYPSKMSYFFSWSRFTRLDDYQNNSSLLDHLIT